MNVQSGGRGYHATFILAHAKARHAAGTSPAPPIQCNPSASALQRVRRNRVRHVRAKAKRSVWRDPQELGSLDSTCQRHGRFVSPRSPRARRTTFLFAFGDSRKAKCWKVAIWSLPPPEWYCSHTRGRLKLSSKTSTVRVSPLSRDEAGTQELRDRCNTIARCGLANAREHAYLQCVF